MIEVVAAVLINNTGKIFIAQRNSPKELAGLWEFPGGKIEEGEKPEESLIREMEEEFAMNIQVLSFLTDCIYHYEFGIVRISSYLAKLLEDTYELREHDDAKWVDIEELEDYKFVPADVKIVEEVKKYIKTINI